MKYIRTKDGVKPICGKNHITNTVSYYNSRGRLSSAKVDDSRIADTIEELCDEFIYTDGTFKNVLYKRLEPIKALIKLRHNYQVFGAIWVIDNNGAPTLKPVARMNDKGELELL